MLKQILGVMVLLSIGGCAVLGGESVSVVGEITEEGGECFTLRTDRGTLFSLANGVRRFRPGDRVFVSGRRAYVSTCPAGNTIIVNRIDPAEPKQKIY